MMGSWRRYREIHPLVSSSMNVRRRGPVGGRRVLRTWLWRVYPTLALPQLSFLSLPGDKQLSSTMHLGQAVYGSELDEHGRLSLKR